MMQPHSPLSPSPQNKPSQANGWVGKGAYRGVARNVEQRGSKDANPGLHVAGKLKVLPKDVEDARGVGADTQAKLLTGSGVRETSECKAMRSPERVCGKAQNSL